MPSSGVVRLASIAGPAMANTRALLMVPGREDGSAINGAGVYRPLAARISRTISQIGTTTTAPSRK